MEHKTREEVIDHSPQNTEKASGELYLESLRRMAEHNKEASRYPLTGLYNMRTFFYLSSELMQQNPKSSFGVIAMDIAQFKSVNEFCGRSEGDRMLKYIADCFRYYEDNRPKTCVCQVRADNFCLFTAFEEEQELVDIVQDIRAKIDEFSFAYRVLPSFGICTSEKEQTSVSYMKDCATIAMQSIKGKFFAEYAFFDDEMRKQMLREKQVENDIVAALKNGELTAFIQPKVNMRTGRIIGGEALVRWRHPERGLISPGVFVPVLEKNGFIINVDRYIWEQIFSYLSRLKQEGRPLVPISINVSRVHAYDKHLCDTLVELTEKYDVPAEYAPLELTESAFLEDEAGMFQRMKKLRDRGFKIAMDDFGTGYSTMYMLKSQNMDEVKMDRIFILDLEDEKSQIVLKYTTAMLLALGSKIIMEGIETEEQKKLVLECGCENAQGFLFYKPMPIEEFDELLRKQEEAQ